LQEGVDVPGDALSCLVITRLPFPVPDDPVFAARAETYDDPFYQFTVPQAVLRFRQGFGRLIRTQTDRGIVAIFDSRLTTRRYGQHFLDALPPCEVRFGPARDLPPLARRWLQGHNGS
ncbi:MAG: helicase C-terminal domain-containing protein, partial [Ardenticatenia bacterium]|nr:helicase C-terminal domain-containing protein [Ardenticatenia bacterium]